MSSHDANVSTGARVALGTLVTGLADLVFAMGFWWVSHQVPPLRILQSIGAGWLGEASFAGGARSAALGAVSHFAIILLFILAYRQAARYSVLLRTRPNSAGAIYGLCLYLLMNFVVLPLSAAGMASFKDLAWVISSIVMHAVIGVLCAHYALAGRPPAGKRASSAAGMPTNSA
ncbi:hypothetical protein [Pseudoxanthomonas indica]|uniref:DUF1440 domain-containing protein n=1 Tax=Pseudoxanthomonas indica TaxID=428993 RepID=A0A1T5KCG1_9GAMM|nr:hypothetical protein [Pseudoxanthomonas indica]SKC61088.1 hypothetical protein SAMN06296058_1551 [Pseudoxanthomonas indica]